MPTEVAVFPEHRLGIARLFGTVTGDTVIQTLIELYTNEPQWIPGYNVVWDCRDIDQLMMSPDEAADILGRSRHLEPRLGAGRTALVMHGSVHYSFAQMIVLTAKSSVRERKVFYSLDEALIWVGAPDAL